MYDRRGVPLTSLKFQTVPREVQFVYGGFRLFSFKEDLYIENYRTNEHYKTHKVYPQSARRANRYIREFSCKNMHALHRNRQGVSSIPIGAPYGCETFIALFLLRSYDQ